MTPNDILLCLSQDIIREAFFSLRYREIQIPTTNMQMVRDFVTLSTKYVSINCSPQGSRTLWKEKQKEYKGQRRGRTPRN